MNIAYREEGQEARGIGCVGIGGGKIGPLVVGLRIRGVFTVIRAGAFVPGAVAEFRVERHVAQIDMRRVRRQRDGENLLFGGCENVLGNGPFHGGRGGASGQAQCEHQGTHNNGGSANPAIHAHSCLHCLPVVGAPLEAHVHVVALGFHRTPCVRMKTAHSWKNNLPELGRGGAHGADAVCAPLVPLVLVAFEEIEQGVVGGRARVVNALAHEVAPAIVVEIVRTEQAGIPGQFHLGIDEVPG